jgi:hypothetical protein
MLHAPRLARINVFGGPPGDPDADIDTAMTVLQPAWEALPTVVKDRRAASAAADAACEGGGPPILQFAFAGKRARRTCVLH